MNGPDTHREARLATLRLARTAGIGPVNFRRLIDRYGDAQTALDALPSLKGAAHLSITSRDAAQRELEAVDRADAALFLLGEPSYPDLLARIADAPAALMVSGRAELLQRPGCAIVGSRNASAVGLRLARDLAAAISAEGLVVTSGLARGIDGAAHTGSLAHGTIAVVAGGIDHIYPPEHARLHHEIAETGLVVSEMPLASRPTARDFPRRNRIISGLTRGTLVVEAAMKSGSLITARLAGEQGREVMAVPGSPLDPRAKGTNHLLREGAHLIESAEDVVELLGQIHLPPPEQVREADDGPFTPFATDTAPEHDTPHAEDAEHSAPMPARDLLDLISPVPVSVDELARQSGKGAGEIQAEILELELTGAVIQLPGARVQRV
ncbi:DNA-processing protein DprA [Maricaulis sp.]|uniref:DNA-processing protein DprA n=1 Tax=Maricaulis sp. TaxID=1486257 RepID=UPI00260CA21B|nr:DNA-processing protein DprA [Maricaulis sp.]